jgi:hypothetical protein
MTVSEFIDASHVRMTSERTDNPNMDSASNMDHWKCIVRRGNVRMTVYFSQGYGHNRQAPELSSVLDCLASDSSSIENASSFESWASDFGYSTDSRTAEKTFKACERQAQALKRFLGSELYQELLFNTERE